MSKRKGISKTVRFEVFKRDRFTCQYCGAKAPDVVLHVDHIHPVADDGPHDILNFATACVDCNSGKGARKLDDRSAVERQRVQIEELQDRREQLEMMLAWRDAEQAEAVNVVDQVSERMAERGGFYASESGKSDIRRWLKRFSLTEILAALDESFDSYMRWSGDKPNEAAWGEAFRKIPAVANMRRESVGKPYLLKLTYVQGILRRVLEDPHVRYMVALEDCVVAHGIDPDELERAAKACASWDDFLNRVVAVRDAKKAAVKAAARAKPPTPQDYDDPYDDDGFDGEED